MDIQEEIREIELIQDLDELKMHMEFMLSRANILEHRYKMALEEINSMRTEIEYWREKVSPSITD